MSWAGPKPVPVKRSAMSMCTPWSTTTPAWPTRKPSTPRTAHACAQFMLRAAHWFSTYGYRIDRVMTDNAMAYRRSQAFADALAQIGAAHKLIRPYRPQTNGKVERFHQTLLGGWAYKQPYDTNAAKPSPDSSTPTITTDPTAHYKANHPSLNRTGIHRGLVVWAICGVVGLV